MDELKEKIDSYVRLVASTEELLKDVKKNKNLIQSKCKTIVKLEIDILTSLDEINKQSDDTKKRKLLLNRLRDCYNQAHDKYELLYADFTISLQQDYQNEYGTSYSKEVNDESNDVQTGILRKFESSNEEFDLERIRRRHNEVKNIEETIDNTNSIFRTLHGLTHRQGETIDSIENNIDNVLIKIQQGNEELSKARDYHVKAMKKLLPFAGAAVAAGFTGPVGLIYGFKIGATAALGIGSGVFGFVGGKAIASKMDHKAIE